MSTRRGGPDRLRCVKNDRPETGIFVGSAIADHPLAPGRSAIADPTLSSRVLPCRQRRAAASPQRSASTSNSSGSATPCSPSRSPSSGRHWRLTAPTAGTAGRATGSASSSAWPRHGPPRWPSTAWPIGGSTPSTPGRPGAHLPAVVGSRSAPSRPSRRPLRWHSSPRRSCSSPIAGRSRWRSPCCSGCSAIRSPSGSRALGPCLAGDRSRRRRRRCALGGGSGVDRVAARAARKLAVLTWVTGFDVIYAWARTPSFDRAHGLRSLPGPAGRPRRARLAAAWPRGDGPRPGRPRVGRTRWGRSTSRESAVVAILLIYEHAIVRPDDLTRVNVAFFQVNVVHQPRACSP